MTTDVHHDLRINLFSMKRPDIVAIIAEHDFVDAALAALVEKLGFRSAVVDLDADCGPLNPVATIVRTAALADRVRHEPSLRGALLIGIGMDLQETDQMTTVGSINVEAKLREILTTTASRYPDLHNRVKVSKREREILETYALGATLRQTCQKHYVAEGTVREHYRRVKHRYDQAGRPVSNKTQLLLQLIADGWVQAPQTPPPAC